MHVIQIHELTAMCRLKVYAQLWTIIIDVYTF